MAKQTTPREPTPQPPRPTVPPLPDPPALSATPTAAPQSAPGNNATQAEQISYLLQQVAHQQQVNTHQQQFNKWVIAKFQAVESDISEIHRKFNVREAREEHDQQSRRSRTNSEQFGK